MTNRINYAFDDVEVTFNGGTYTISGLLPVEYSIDPIDRSVGIFYPSVEIEAFGPVDAEMLDENDYITSVTVEPGTEIHNQILRSFRAGYIEEACMDDYNFRD